MDDQDYLKMLKDMKLWLHGYCSALGGDSPFPPEYFLAFAAAEGALMQRHKKRLEDILAANTSLAPTTAPEEHGTDEDRHDDDENK